MEAPAIQDAHAKFGDKLHIVGVVSGPDSAVDEAKLMEKIFELGLTYDQVRDRDLELTRHFGVTGTPTVIILDGTGKVTYENHEAPHSWNEYL